MADIGAGVIILIIVWGIALISILVFCSAQGKLKFIAIIPVAVAALLTIILIAIPKGAIPANSNDPDYNYSYTSLIWIFILTALCVTFLASLLCFFQLDILEFKYARVDRGLHFKQTR